MNRLKKWVQFILFAGAGAAAAACVIEKMQEKAEPRETVLAHTDWGIYETWLKRPIDAFLAAVGLITLSPVLAVTALVVRVKLGTPVLFAQERPGRDERLFRLYKFRTMTDARDADGALLPDEERLTATGNLLRSTSLDELPELFNILKGDMALVGPRPLLVRYLDRYDAFQRRRHEVRPGLTGYAQVHGRNSISWQEKFRMDVRYVDHITFLEDLRIVLDTIRTVVKREGISSGTSATMEEFMGNEVED